MFLLKRDNSFSWLVGWLASEPIYFIYWTQRKQVKIGKCHGATLKYTSGSKGVETWCFKFFFKFLFLASVGLWEGFIDSHLSKFSPCIFWEKRAVVFRPSLRLPSNCRSSCAVHFFSTGTPVKIAWFVKPYFICTCIISTNKYTR